MPLLALCPHPQPFFHTGMAAWFVDFPFCLTEAGPREAGQDSRVVNCCRCLLLSPSKTAPALLKEKLVLVEARSGSCLPS